MAESVVFSEETAAPLRKVSIAVTSASDGTATGTSDGAFTGQVVAFAANPDTGAAQPTNAFDVVITDEDGLDILAGNGANLVNTGATWVTSGLGAVVMDKLTLDASNMGDTKDCTFVLFIQ